ncbi:carboxymuconolactone decarboxylase family protein [Sphingobium lignivorans]|uniref:Alkylhydroperoxidase family enzyme n=1 Tax=Sphingobium lignivorans TaxID=2735886 RepID=A0ABR6NIK7_9SPHN|nr:carboxymuconolactone decarboxylase family protein [Sphingobium lignivorans]MBB5987122.1 alkylhydroperoxidase family enzyme [Sphingobium lignivorans]
MNPSRILPAPPAADAEGMAAEAQIRASRGRISALYGILLHSRPVAAGWEALLTAIRQKTGIAPALRELIILRIAVLNEAPYEFEQHVPHAQAAGLSSEKIAACRDGDRAPFDPIEALVLDYTDSMTRQIQVPAPLFERVSAVFDAQGIVELTATIAAYNMVSRFLEALHVR